MSESSGHLSIGEVLALVQAEFPDVTISKIRFLESQGLIDPERTPSGYRKFYEPDIVRLRWILRQQRDHFLPLKVIKAKLDQPGQPDDEPAQPDLWSGSGVERGGGPARSSEPGPGVGGVEPGHGSVERGADGDSAAWLAALQEAPRRHVSAGLGRSAYSSDRPATSADPTSALPAAAADPAPAEIETNDDGIRFGAAEIAELTGVTVALIDELVEFGLVAPVLVGGESTFDAAAIEVIRACARFSTYGVGGRHLRIYKNAADREVGFYEQIILPLLKQRNPKARGQATESLAHLVEAGEALHHALIRQALRPHL